MPILRWYLCYVNERGWGRTRRDVREKRKIWLMERCSGGTLAAGLRRSPVRLGSWFFFPGPPAPGEDHLEVGRDAVLANTFYQRPFQTLTANSVQTYEIKRNYLSFPNTRYPTSTAFLSTSCFKLNSFFPLFRSPPLQLFKLSSLTGTAASPSSGNSKCY